MAIPRFHVSAIVSDTLALDADQSRHALQSLRLRPGDEVLLFDGRGTEAHGRLPPPTDVADSSRPASARRRLAEIEILSVTLHERPRHKLTLYVAGCKGPRLSWLVEKCTELGVTRLSFTEFERSVVRVSPSHADKLARTAIEACKQCGRVWLPEIKTGTTVADLVGRQNDTVNTDAESEKLLIAHPRTYEDWSIADWLKANTWNAVGVVIGPEGGLTDAEVESLRAAGATPVHLAEHILRVETAALSAAAVWAALMWE